MRLPGEDIAPKGSQFLIHSPPPKSCPFPKPLLTTYSATRDPQSEFKLIIIWFFIKKRQIEQLRLTEDVIACVASAVVCICYLSPLVFPAAHCVKIVRMQSYSDLNVGKYGPE